MLLFCASHIIAFNLPVCQIINLMSIRFIAARFVFYVTCSRMSLAQNSRFKHCNSERDALFLHLTVRRRTSMLLLDTAYYQFKMVVAAPGTCFKFQDQFLQLRSSRCTYITFMPCITSTSDQNILLMEFPSHRRRSSKMRCRVRSAVQKYMAIQQFNSTCLCFVESSCVLGEIP